jgi:cell division protein FtsW
MLRPGHALAIIVLALLTLGVVMVTSAAVTVGAGAPMSLGDVLWGRPALFALLAVAAMFVGSRVSLDRLYERRGLRSPIPWIVIVSLGLLLLVHVPGIGREVNGAKRWIDLGPIGFQPSELVKWGVLLVIAWHVTRRAGSMGRLGSGFIAPLLLVGAMMVLIATEDLGTAVLIGMVSVAMLLAAGAKLRYALMLLPAAPLCFAAAVVASPYRIARLKAFLDPFQDPQGIGYHVLQSMSAVSGGGLAGRGLGGGLHKFGYLPEDTTDFIFAIVAEELGFAGAALVVCLYVALILCGYAIVQRCHHPFQRVLGLGILLTIGLQALINMLVVTGLAPTKGIALPLLSSGGTGWCLTAFCVGLLISMDRTQRIGAARDAPENLGTWALS